MTSFLWLYSYFSWRIWKTRGPHLRIYLAKSDGSWNGFKDNNSLSQNITFVSMDFDNTRLSLINFKGSHSKRKSLQLFKLPWCSSWNNGIKKILRTQKWPKTQIDSDENLASFSNLKKKCFSYEVFSFDFPKKCLIFDIFQFILFWLLIW